MSRRFLYLLLLPLIVGCSDDDEPLAIDREYLSEPFFLPSGINVDVYFPSDYDEGREYPIVYFNDGDGFADVFIVTNGS